MDGGLCVPIGLQMEKLQAPHAALEELSLHSVGEIELLHLAGWKRAELQDTSAAPLGQQANKQVEFLARHGLKHTHLPTYPKNTLQRFRGRVFD